MLSLYTATNHVW